MPDNSIKNQQKPSIIQSLTKFIVGIGKYTIILCVFLILMIPAIYHFGSYHRHELDPHPLYNLFDGKQYTTLYKNLVQKEIKKIIVTGDFNSGLKQFLDHFANVRTIKGYQVVINEIYRDDIPIIPYLRQLKNNIEDQLDMQSNKPLTWIVIDENQFPAQELGLIMARHPNDRFIVAVDQKVKLQQNNDFKKYVFQPLSIEQFKSAVVSQLKVPAENIEPLFNYFGNISAIFDVIDENQQGLVPQNILAENFKSKSILSNDEKLIVQKLCTEGPQKVASPSKNLKGFGVITFEQTIYWKNRLAELNYQLQTHKVCPADSVVPQTILDKIEAEERAKKMKASAQASNNQNGGKKTSRRRK